MEHIAQWQVPEGTEYLCGHAGPDSGRPGRGRQMYPHDPSVLQQVH